jgi:hypothetical protein
VQHEPNIHQALIEYIIQHDSSYTEAKLISYSVLDLIVLKTEIELQDLKSKATLP